MKTAQEAAAELEPYAKAGLPTLTTPPGELVEELKKLYVNAVSDEVADIVKTCDEKSKTASTDASKLRAYTSAIDKLKKLARDFPDAPLFTSAADRMVLALDHFRFELACRKAETEAAKGKRTKAAETLIEAMIALKYDNTPDKDQEALFAEARSRITELGGTAPF